MKTIDDFITKYERIAKTKIEDAEEYTANALQIFKSMDHCYYCQKVEKERQVAEWNKRAAECEESAAECQQLIEILKQARATKNVKEKKFTIQHDVMEGETSILSLIEQVTYTMCEERDKFIYEAIGPYVDSLCQNKIPKKLLERALSAFCKEHPEEWEMLLKEAENDG